MNISFLKHKSDSLDAFMMFKNGVKNKKGYRIKYLQSDNSTEYCDKVQQTQMAVASDEDRWFRGPQGRMELKKDKLGRY